MKKRWVLKLGLISFLGIMSLPPSSSYGQHLSHKEVVDSSGQLGIGDVVLKVSPNKGPVISFISQPNQDASLEIRLKQNGEWKSIVTDPLLINISGLSMAIDSNGNFHFGLIRQDQVTLQRRPVYSIFNQTSWAIEEIDTFDSHYVDMDLDSNGLPAICYICNIGTQDWPIRLICEYKNAEKWKELFMVSSTSEGDLYFPSLKFDSKDVLHVSYTDSPNSTEFPTSLLNYIKYEEIPEVEDGIMWGYNAFYIQQSKIVANSTGLPYVIYVLRCPICTGPGPYQLNYTYKTSNTEWRLPPGYSDIQLHISVEEAVYIPSISMAIDSNDNLHILYSHILPDTQYRGNDSRFIAKIMYGDWDHLTGGWELSEIDSWKGDYAILSFQTSLSIDSVNHPHISYVLPQDESGNGYNLIYGILSDSLPDISVTPMAYNFRNVKLKKSKTTPFKVKNNGTADLSILTSTITGTDASMFTITSGSGSKTIKPGKTLTIKVGFKPTSTGSKTSTLRISSNDPDSQTIDIPLSGAGK